MSAALITNVDKKQLRTTKFPPEFEQKVDMEKVNVPVIKKWVQDEIARILNSDDDIVTELISNVLEESNFVRLYQGFLCDENLRFWGHVCADLGFF